MINPFLEGPLGVRKALGRGPVSQFRADVVSHLFAQFLLLIVATRGAHFQHDAVAKIQLLIRLRRRFQQTHDIAI